MAVSTTSSAHGSIRHVFTVVVPHTDDEGNRDAHLNNTTTKVAVGSDESGGLHSVGVRPRSLPIRMPN